MSAENKTAAIKWYRCPVSREDLRALNQRSDFKGMLQTAGHLGALALTGTCAYMSIGRLAWPLVVLIFFLHGTCFAYLTNGFHELVHDSVFKTRFLNRFFLWIFSFLGSYNHIAFWASHTEHHKYTLHPPDDLEVVLPMKVSLKGFLASGFVNVRGAYQVLKMNLRLGYGRLEGEWEHALFPESDPVKRRKLFNWARILLVGHGSLAVIFLLCGLWPLPVLITLAPFYGGWLQQLCNHTQHIGLQDNVPDFRVCCRTVILNPLVRFLYWHMNYHIEHHMYAAVPCYNLGRLHKLIRDDLPHCPHGLIRAWREITTILKRQSVEPDYQYAPELPSSATP